MSGNRYRRWLPEEDDWLRKLTLEGRSPKEIAIILGRTFESVRVRGIKLRVHPGRAVKSEGEKLVQIRASIPAAQYARLEAAAAAEDRTAAQWVSRAVLAALDNW